MEEYFYEVDLSWSSEKSGSLSSHGLKDIKVVSPAHTPNEKKQNWTPEHLLAASVSACFMTTFLEIAEKAKLHIITYQSQCFVKLEKVNGKFVTSEILIRPLIKLENSRLLTKANKCIEEAEVSCPSRNSLKINVEVHPMYEFIKEDTVSKTL